MIVFVAGMLSLLVGALYYIREVTVALSSVRTRRGLVRTWVRNQKRGVTWNWKEVGLIVVPRWTQPRHRSPQDRAP